MKKLILVLLTATAASCALAGFAGCTNGQTGGGDNAAESENYSVQMQSTQEDTSDDSFGFLPPENMPMNHGDRLPPLPHGHMFNGMRPDFMPEPAADGTAPEQEQIKEPEIKGQIRRKRNKKGDQVTPDGNFAPDSAKAEEQDGSAQTSEEKSSGQDKAPHKKRKRNKRQPESTEDSKTTPQ